MDKGMRIGFFGGQKFVLSVNILVFAIFTIAGVFIIQVVKEHERQVALEEARVKADIILNNHLATHWYFTNHLKPSVFKVTENIRSDEYFDPHWMSSTYAVREIDRKFREYSKFNKYYYKEAAVNARTPANEADEVERAFIERLNAGEDLELVTDVRTIDGTVYFVVMHKGETMEESCLMCHTTPDNAPADLVSYYGGERSFDREAGDVVSAVSIRIPLTEATKRSQALTNRLYVLLMIILGVLMVSQIFITQRLKTSNMLLSKALDDKDMLIREVHHRVKNNLAVVQSLFRLQMFDMTDEQSRAHIQEAQNRVKSMALIHDRLQNAEDLKHLSTASYLEELVNMVFASYKVSAEVKLELDIEDVQLDVDTMVPLALIINELISNVMKHAFSDADAEGVLRVSLKQVADGEYLLRVQDNGSGFPKGFRIEDSTSLGMRIVVSQVDQLMGTMDIKNEGGMDISVRFKDLSEEEQS